MDSSKPFEFECYKQNRKIIIAKKLEVINFAKNNNIQKAADKYGVSTKSIRRWRDNEQKFIQVLNPGKRITLHPQPPNRLKISNRKRNL